MLGVGGEIPSSEPVDRIVEELRIVLRERDQLSLRAAALAGKLSRTEYADEYAAVSTADWMRHEFKLGYQAAADLVRVGLEMDSLPTSVAAVEAAEIGFQHLVFMARTKAAVGSRPLNEEHLLAEAKQVSVGRFWHLCQQARHAADAPGVARSQALAVEAREFRINQQQDGMVTISGLLDPIGGAALKAALDPLAQKAGKDDTRDRERRLADALIELAQHAMDQATPRQRPHLNVTATIGTLYFIPGSAAAEMEHGTPVSEVTVNRIACDCSVTRHIFDSESVLIDLGREKRVVSPKLRKALERRDQHCRWPGCTRPATRCEAHHLIPWMRGGPTNAQNLVLLCTRHHWQVHEGRWQLFLDPDSRLKVVRPPLDFAAPPRAPACA
jgi:hypothetical protein